MHLAYLNHEFLVTLGRWFQYTCMMCTHVDLSMMSGVSDPWDKNTSDIQSFSWQALLETFQNNPGKHLSQNKV